MSHPMDVPVTAVAVNGAPVVYIVVVEGEKPLPGLDDKTYFIGPVVRYVGELPAEELGVSIIPLQATVTVQEGTPPLIVTTSIVLVDEKGEPTTTLLPPAPTETKTKSTTVTPTETPATLEPSASLTITNAPTRPTNTENTDTPNPRSTTSIGNIPTPGTSPNLGPEPQSNTGAVVGAAIGCLIAGLVLGFLVAFFLFRRRSQRQPQYAPPPTVIETKAFDTTPPPPPLPPAPHVVVGDKLSRYLLDASPDKEIAAELRSLGTLIQQHVENNYHLRPLQADPRTLTMALSQLGVTGGGSSLSPEVVAELALSPRTRQVILQHVISLVLFTSIDVNSRSRLSMLPAPIAAFLQSIPPRENGETTNHEVLSIALNQWRSLSAFILHPSRSQRTPLSISTAAVSSQAAGLADALDTFLDYFVDENNLFQQKTHLEAVITECAKFGYVLLSQPHEWHLVNNPGPGHQQGYTAVVRAGLVKVPLRDGSPAGSPQQVVEPMTVVV